MRLASCGTVFVFTSTSFEPGEPRLVAVSYTRTKRSRLSRGFGDRPNQRRFAARAAGLDRVPQVPARLEIHPELRRHLEQVRQAQRGIRGDATLAENEFVQAIER